MGALFSPSSTAASEHATSQPAAPQLSEQDKAIMQLKTSRDKLQKYRKKAEREREILDKNAREQVKNGRKDKALVALKTKRIKDQRLKKLETQLDNVGRLLDSIEEASVTTQVMTALEAGNVELKKLNDELPIEKIEEIMQDSEEAIAHQDEILAILGQALTTEDTAQVDLELNQLAAEVSGVDRLPEVPTSKVAAPEPKRKEPVARQLQAA
jgi:charged multivesicular body protein 6